MNLLHQSSLTCTIISIILNYTASSFRVLLIYLHYKVVVSELSIMLSARVVDMARHACCIVCYLISSRICDNQILAIRGDLREHSRLLLAAVIWLVVHHIRLRYQVGNHLLLSSFLLVCDVNNTRIVCIFKQRLGALFSNDNLLLLLSRLLRNVLSLIKLRPCSNLSHI